MNISRQNVQDYFFGNPTSIAERILFVKRAAKLADYKKRLTGVQEFGNVWQGINGVRHGQKITVVATGIGPGMVGDAVYAVNRPDSICLYSGTCGGLDPALQIGDYFVPDHAVCADGFTFHLGHTPLTEVSGDSNALSALKMLLIEETGRTFNGTSFTTCSVVREADSDFWNTVDKKCRIIEMGASAFYAASAATHKRAAAYFWVSDLPNRGKSFFDELPSEDIRRKQDAHDRSVDFDLELITSL